MTRLIATLSIILVALLALTGWLIWYGPSPDDDTDDRLALANNSLVGGAPAEIGPDDEASSEKLPIKGLHVALQERADIVSFASNTNLILYDQETGLISTFDPLSSNSQSEPLAQINPGAKKLIWSSDGSKLIAHYVGKSMYYDFTVGTTHTYSAKIYSPVFDFKSDKTIIYSYVDSSGANYISLGESFASSFKNITPTRLQNPQLEPLTEAVLAITGKTAISKYRSSLGLLQKNTGELKVLVAGYENIETMWAPSHTQLVYSVVKPTTNTVALYYLNAATGFRRELPVSTIATKCAWSSDELTILCAVPIEQETYYALTNDSVLRINPFTQVISVETLIPATSLDIKNLIFSELNNMLFMNDKRGSGVYGFRIEEE
jgi:hypothetical protein